MTFARGSRWASAGAVLLALSCAPPPRAGDTVVVASGADLESANPLVTVHPLARQVQRYALFVTLARYDSALAAVPYYARAWEWSDDRRMLTLQLAGSLRWHDGRPTTARDAVWTIEAARDPATGYARSADLAAIARAQAPDDTTLVLHFVSPQPAFPRVLCELPVLPRHLLANVPRAAMRQAEFGRSPVGNGPFRFVRRDPGARWIFERDSAFPPALGGPPRLRRLVIAVVDEPTTKFAGLVSGSLDVAGISPSMAALARRDPAITVVDYPVLFSVALVLNPARPPFDDVRVRRAIDLALDRERIVSAAVAGFATPAASGAPPASPLALPLLARRDTARADSLLDLAGWRRDENGARRRDGRALTLELLTVGSGDNALEQLVQADLGARGIAASIRQLELGAFLDLARAPVKRFDALVTGIPGDAGLAHLAGMYDSRLAGGTLDYAGYHTRRLDSLFAAARRAPTEALERAAWLEIQRDLARDAPAVWIYHARGVQGLSRRLAGVRMDLRGELPTVHDWSVTGAASPSVAVRR